MDFNYSQYVVDPYFRIAKTKDQNFADNIDDYMFMYRKGDDLYLVDSGGQYLFGTTDVTRTISLNNNSNFIKNY